MNAFKGGFAVLLTLVAWLIFAPLNLGGAFAYVYVHGSSMSPHLQNGDVVLLRSAERYAVGDVVAVRNPDIGLVLHRIIADDGEHLTVQGDNRKTPDSFRPTTADIAAKEWMHFGGVGTVLEKLQEPALATAIGGGVVLLMLAGFFAKHRGGSKPGDDGKTGGRVASSRGPRTRPGLAESLTLHSQAGQAMAGVLALLLLAAGGLAALYMLKTEHHAITETLAISELGRFSYGNRVPGGVYNQDRLSPPQPVFLELTKHLPVSFDYQLAPRTLGEKLENVTGSYRLAVEVQHPNGWSKALPLQTITLFSGSSAHVEGVVDMSQVLATIQTTETQTGVVSLLYNLRIVANLAADGTFGGVPFSREVEQAIAFRLTEKQLQFDVKNSTLQADANATVSRQRIVPRAFKIPIVGGVVPFAWFPLMAAGAVGVAAIGFALLGFGTLIVSRLGEPARIRARYRHMLVAVAADPPVVAEAPMSGDTPVANASPPATARAGRKSRERRARPLVARAAPSVEVTPAVPATTPVASVEQPAAPGPLVVTVDSFDDLAHLAEQRGLAVLWSTRDGTDDYRVIDNVTYQYITTSAPEATEDARAADDVAARRRLRLVESPSPKRRAA